MQLLERIDFIYALNERINQSNDIDEIYAVITSRPFKLYFKDLKELSESNAIKKLQNSFEKLSIKPKDLLKVLKSKRFEKFFTELETTPPASKQEIKNAKLEISAIFSIKDANFKYYLYFDKQLKNPTFKNFLVGGEHYNDLIIKALRGQEAPFGFGKWEIDLSKVLEDRELEEKGAIEVSEFEKDPTINSKYVDKNNGGVKSLKKYLEILLAEKGIDPKDIAIRKIHLSKEKELYQ